MGEIRNVNKILVGKSLGKRLIGRHRFRILKNFKEIGSEDMDWIHLAEGSIKGREFLDYLIYC
jgi:hypothetical protein